MLYSDLGELKRVLQIEPGDKSEDVSLSFFLEQASTLMEEIMNRRGMEKKQRTEYYNGTGTQELLLRSRPVFLEPLPEIYVDGNGFFGAVSGSFNAHTLIDYGGDWSLWIDDPDNNTISRCGIVIRNHAFWPRPRQRVHGLLTPYLGDSFGNIKIIYTGGYTVDTLPSDLRQACNLLVARMRYIFPLGMELTSESYEERNISMSTPQKNYLTALVRPTLMRYRNWSW